MLEEVSERTDRHIFGHLGHDNGLSVKGRAADRRVKILGGPLGSFQSQSGGHQKAQYQRVEANNVFLVMCLENL
jgi:hypothetical protein